VTQLDVAQKWSGRLEAQAAAALRVAAVAFALQQLRTAKPRDSGGKRPFSTMRIATKVTSARSHQRHRTLLVLDLGCKPRS